MKKLHQVYLLTACAALTLAAGAKADALRERIAERIQEKGGLMALDTARAHNKPTATVRYGSDPNQRFDVYVTGKTQDAPVIFMVHGGGWKRGDKGMSGVVDNKLERWGHQGVVFMSANYRMLPAADPYVQVEDIALALAQAQGLASRWGADAKRFVLIGHSAGAHLVALLMASPALLQKYGALPPIGTISLDSATLDVVKSMQARHFDLYDNAFGKDHDFWVKASPWHALSGKPAPFLAVCSTRRGDACPQAQRFADKVRSFGGMGEVLREDLSHAEINKQLGLPGAYTEAVEHFLRKLDPALAKLN